jgi:hypothetical protein
VWPVTVNVAPCATVRTIGAAFEAWARMLRPKGLSTVRTPLVCTTEGGVVVGPVVAVVDEEGGAAALPDE